MTNPQIDQPAPEGGRLAALTNTMVGNPDKHTGALKGFGYAVATSFIVGLASIIFPIFYSRDVNGPVACGLAVFMGLAALGATSYWLTPMNKNATNRNLVGGFFYSKK